MLTLITGTPGAGKTLFTLERVLKETIPEKGKQRRPIFVHNIADIDYQFFQAQELTDPEKWYELPEHSLIVFDEAQFAFPQRTKDVKPRKVEEFSTHRHRGYDIFITTQDPMNVDVFIRRMCGRHFHIHRILNREAATVYEFDHYQDNPTGFQEKKSALAKFVWKFPRKLFDRYKSATQHTHRARTPLRLFAIPLLVFGIGFLGWRVYNNMKSAPEMQQGALNSDSSPFSPARIMSGPEDDGIAWTVGEWFKMREPVLDGVLHTAPIYQSLAKPRTFPKPYCVIVGEVKSGLGGDCQCFTQQGTQYETKDQFCRYWVFHGYFDDSISESGKGGGPDANASRAAGPDARDPFKG